MGNVVKLFDATNDGRHWNCGDVLKQALKEYEDGEIKSDAQVIVLHLPKDSIDVGFAQNGLGAKEMIAILEIAKMKVYNEYIADKE